MQTIDFSTVPPQALAELNRQGEACLQGTVQLAIANDQRAVTLTGMFGAAAGALAALVGALVAATHEPSLALFWAIGAAAALLFLAAILCAISAKPADFFVNGYEPRLLAQGCAGEDLTPILRAALEDVQNRIDRNRAALVRSARVLTSALWIGGAALPIAVVAFTVLSVCLRPS
jgi:hypothetical protein